MRKRWGSVRNATSRRRATRTLTACSFSWLLFAPGTTWAGEGTGPEGGATENVTPGTPQEPVENFAEKPRWIFAYAMAWGLGVRFAERPLGRYGHVSILDAQALFGTDSAARLGFGMGIAIFEPVLQIPFAGSHRIGFGIALAAQQGMAETTSPFDGRRVTATFTGLGQARAFYRLDFRAGSWSPFTEVGVKAPLAWSIKRSRGYAADPFRSDEYAGSETSWFEGSLPALFYAGVGL
jgi:hypothetical protein